MEEQVIQATSMLLNNDQKTQLMVDPCQSDVQQKDLVLQ